ncbi:PepSY domain-containing protein [Aureimonas psammosilenae]|jgi:hypothetical protein|uniref:PepSY domain-containing protein n=1 Tax=Aureimonas psammosilenae TaxID=2495496 RepID=UPI00126049E7|nr:PepSY domain-containing protein [Aureimonas psammosilenae]
MKKIATLVLAAVGLSTLAIPAAFADDRACTTEPRERWLPVAEVTKKVEALGYTVREIEADDGCYEVSGTDRNGAKIELDLDPVSGEIAPARR